MIATSIANNIIRTAVERNGGFSAFGKQVKEHQNKYNIDDIFYGWSGHEALELVEGYFFTREEYNTLNEAIENMKYGDALRVIDGEKFIIGQYSKTPNNDAEHCVNVKTFEIVY